MSNKFVAMSKEAIGESVSKLSLYTHHAEGITKWLSRSNHIASHVRRGQVTCSARIAMIVKGGYTRQRSKDGIKDV